MNKNKYFHLSNIALLTLLSGNAMAFDFPTIPGTGGTGGGTTTPSAVLIFTCKNVSIESSTNTSSSSCSSSGNSGSSCSSSTAPGRSVQSSVLTWEMSAERAALKTLLNDPTTTCSEALESIGASNCNPSGGGSANTTVYTCKI